VVKTFWYCVLGREGAASGTVGVWSSGRNHQVTAGGHQQFTCQPPTLSAWVCGNTSAVLCTVPQCDAGFAAGYGQVSSSVANLNIVLMLLLANMVFLFISLKRLWPQICLLYQSLMMRAMLNRWGVLMEWQWWLVEENWSIQRETCPSATLFTTNL